MGINNDYREDEIQYTANVIVPFLRKEVDEIEDYCGLYNNRFPDDPIFEYIGGELDVPSFIRLHILVVLSDTRKALDEKMDRLMGIK